MYKQVKFSTQHFEVVEGEETQDLKIELGSVKVFRDNRMDQSNNHDPIPKDAFKKVYLLDNMRKFEDINFTSMRAAAEEALKYNSGQQYEAPSNSLRTIDGVMAEPMQMDGGLVPLPSALPVEGANTFANIFPSCSRGKQSSEEPPSKKSKEEKPEETDDITDKEQIDITEEQNDIAEEQKDITDEQNDAEEPDDLAEIKDEITEIQETDKEILFSFDSESDFSLFDSESSIDDDDLSE